MTRDLRIKGLFIGLGILVCLYFIYPTFRWSTYTPEEQDALKGDTAKGVLGTWKEEEAMVRDQGMFANIGFSLKKWWQGDNEKVINLGLDLQGGLFVVLEVQLDDAVRVQNQNVRERLKDTLTNEKIDYLRIADITNTVIELSFTNNALAKSALNKIRASGDYADMLSLPNEDDVLGTMFKVVLKGTRIGDIHKRALEQARYVVENRINQLGLTEPSIQVQPPSRVIVQLPGEKDPNRILKLMKQTAKLEFHLLSSDRNTERVIKILSSIDRQFEEKLLVEDNQTEERVPYKSYRINDSDTEYFQILLAKPEVQSRIPADCMLLLGRRIPGAQGGVYRDFALVEKDVAIDGMSLKDAKVTVQGAGNNRVVTLKLDAQGGKRLATTSKQTARLYKSENKVSRLGIILDDVIYSAPLLLEYIPGGDAVIRGQFTERDAADLALVLRSGALPAKLEIAQNRTVGASLGSDSIRKGVISGIIGTGAVLLFMLCYYLVPGAIANVALVLNVLILLAVLALFRATLTLPGIAGIVLTIGMAVDANVLIFERIREELAAGKAARQAVKDGFARAWITIFDSNLTTIFTGIILYILGTGPIKGFGLTLIIGLVGNLVTAVFVCRYILDVLLQREGLLSLRMMQMFKRPNLDFLGKRKMAFTISLVVIAAGAIMFMVRAGNQSAAIKQGKAGGQGLFNAPMFGVELTGGDMVRFDFSKRVAVSEMRDTLASVGLGESVIQSVNEKNQILIRCAFNSSAKVLEAVQQKLAAANPQVLEETRIGPAIGENLASDAVLAIAASLVIMILYLWWRFEIEYGLGAMVALLHDVLIVVAACALTGRPITLNTVAALLTIVGFSVNDTIVIFDRIREDLRIEKKMNMISLMNLAMNQTLSRTIFTTSTVVFVVLAQYLFGGEVINDFAFAMLVGLISGTYSTIYVANPVVLFVQSIKRKLARA